MPNTQIQAYAWIRDLERGEFDDESSNKDIAQFFKDLCKTSYVKIVENRSSNLSTLKANNIKPEQCVSAKTVLDALTKKNGKERQDSDLGGKSEDQTETFAIDGTQVTVAFYLHMGKDQCKKFLERMQKHLADAFLPCLEQENQRADDLQAQLSQMKQERDDAEQERDVLQAQLSQMKQDRDDEKQRADDLQAQLNDPGMIDTSMVAFNDCEYYTCSPNIQGEYIAFVNAPTNKKKCVKALLDYVFDTKDAAQDKKDRYQRALRIGIDWEVVREVLIERREIGDGEYIDNGIFLNHFLDENDYDMGHLRDDMYLDPTDPTNHEANKILRKAHQDRYNDRITYDHVSVPMKKYLIGLDGGDARDFNYYNSDRCSYNRITEADIQDAINNPQPYDDTPVAGAPAYWDRDSVAARALAAVAARAPAAPESDLSDAHSVRSGRSSSSGRSSDSDSDSDLSDADSVCSGRSSSSGRSSDSDDDMGFGLFD